jgi:hypothetical protein
MVADPCSEAAFAQSLLIQNFGTFLRLGFSDSSLPSLSNDDPEVSYFFAAHLAYCGQAAPALQMLDSAVRANYCSYPAMDSDPLLANLRGRSEFAEIRSRAMACNRRFLSETKQIQ